MLHSENDNNRPYSVQQTRTYSKRPTETERARGNKRDGTIVCYVNNASRAESYRLT